MVQVIRQQPDFSWPCPPRSGQGGGGVPQLQGLETIFFVQGLETIVVASKVMLEDFEDYCLSRLNFQTSTRK